MIWSSCKERNRSIDDSGLGGTTAKTPMYTRIPIADIDHVAELLRNITF